MDIKIADRLLALRKKAGYSQDELADKIGVSRQAVSKWERGEASPDTDNLIALAKLYGVGLDDLVNCDRAMPNVNPADNNPSEDILYSDDKGNRVDISDSHIHVRSAEGTEVNIGGNLGKFIKDKITDNIDKVNVASSNPDIAKKHITVDNTGGIVISDSRPKWVQVAKDVPIFLVSVLAYLLLGFLLDLWHPAWLVFFIIPVYYGIWDAVEKRNPQCVPVAVLITGVYLLLGFQWGLWHPYWALFFLVPVYHISVEPIKKKTSITITRNDTPDNDREDN